MVVSIQSSHITRQLKEVRFIYEQGKEKHNDENFSAAFKLFSQTVKVQESLLGKYHQDTIKTYWRMGKAACMAKDDREALKAFQRATRMAETSFDGDINQNLWKDLESCWRERHKETDPSVEQLALILRSEQQGDAACKKRHFQKAIECYDRALGIQGSLLGADSLDGADIRCKLACCLLRLSKVQKALQVLHAAHECYLRNLGEQHPATLGAAANMKTMTNMSQKDAMKKRSWFSASLSSLGSSTKHSTTCP